MTAVWGFVLGAVSIGLVTFLTTVAPAIADRIRYGKQPKPDDEFRP